MIVVVGNRQPGKIIKIITYAETFEIRQSFNNLVAYTTKMIPTSLSDNIPYLIGDIEHRIYQEISRIFRENKVKATIEQFTVLSTLWYEDGLKQQELAERLNRDKTTITRIINNMVLKNLVVKVPDKADRRAHMVYLTHLGRQLQEKLMLLTGPVYMKLMNGLKKDEISTSIIVLNKILINLKNQ